MPLDIAIYEARPKASVDLTFAPPFALRYSHRMGSPNAPLFLLAGNASEYVLAPLAAALAQAGHEVREIDFGNGDADWRQFKKRPGALVFLTSAHPYVTTDWAQRYLPVYAEKYGYVPSPLQMIEHLRPEVSVLLPHDLGGPILRAPLNEFTALPTFDFYCDPGPAPSVFAGWAGGCQILHTGWVKALDRRDTVPGVEPRRMLLLPSMIEYLRQTFGDEGFVNYFAPLLGPRVSIKLPAWHGIEKIEDIIRSRHRAQVVPADAPLYPLMRMHDIVVSNSNSSVLSESLALGRQTIVLLDDEGHYSIAAQKRGLPRHPDLLMHDYRTALPIDFDALPPPRTPQPAVFDVDLLVSAIFSHLKASTVEA